MTRQRPDRAIEAAALIAHGRREPSGTPVDPKLGRTRERSRSSMRGTVRRRFAVILLLVLAAIVAFLRFSPGTDEVKDAATRPTPNPAGAQRTPAAAVPTPSAVPSSPAAVESP